MRGETPQQVPPWYETTEPGVNIDTGLLPWKPRLVRMLRVAALCVEAVAANVGDEPYYPELRAINQGYIESYPEAAVPAQPSVIEHLRTDTDLV